MSETDEVFPGRNEMFFPRDTSCFTAIASAILFSLKIFLRNKQLFLSFFVLVTLPLSLLIFSLSLSSHPLKSHIYNLEAVVSISRLSPPRFEDRHVWKESRADARSLLGIKAVFFLPIYLLSLIAAITSVHSTASACKGTRPTLLTAATAVKLTWKRPLVTTIFVYAISLMYAYTLAVLSVSPGSGFIILIVGSSVEIYLMAVLSLGLVVSIVEEKSGWDAIRVGSGVMANRRVSGWVLSGLFVFISGVIAGQLSKETDGRDLSWESSISTATRVANGVRNKVGLIFLYGVLVLWNYVVTTVFYCECRKRHMTRSEDESIIVDL